MPMFNEPVSIPFNVHIPVSETYGNPPGSAPVYPVAPESPFAHGDQKNAKVMRSIPDPALMRHDNPVCYRPHDPKLDPEQTGWQAQGAGQSDLQEPVRNGPGIDVMPELPDARSSIARQDMVGLQMMFPNLQVIRFPNQTTTVYAAAGTVYEINVPAGAMMVTFAWSGADDLFVSNNSVSLPVNFGDQADSLVMNPPPGAWYHIRGLTSLTVMCNASGYINAQWFIGG